MIFVAKILFWGFWAKRDQIGSKIKFSSIMKKQYMELFWFFLGKIYFAVLRPRAVQNEPRVRFFKF